MTWYEVTFSSVDENGIVIDKETCEVDENIYKWMKRNDYRQIGKSGKMFVRNRITDWGAKINDFVRFN